MNNSFLENSLGWTIEEWLRYHQSNLHFEQKYRELQMMKNPFDLVVYEEILWEVKPDIVIEIGSAQGGFTLWLTDRMKLINSGAKVINIDLLDNSNKNLNEMEYDNIFCLVGDCNSGGILDQVKAFIKSDNRVLLIEDSAHTFDNTLEVLENYKDIVTVGSYLIVEDGICDVLNIGPVPGPMKAVEEWIVNNRNYEIDRSKERYVMTYNPKGYLKRIA